MSQTCAGTTLPSFEHNRLKWSCDKQRISRDNSLVFMNLWLGFRISAYGQGLGSSFRFSGSVLSVRA